MQTLIDFNHRKLKLLNIGLSLFFLYWFFQQFQIEKTFYNFELVQQYRQYSFLNLALVDFIVSTNALYLSCTIGICAAIALLFSKKFSPLYFVLWLMLFFVLYRNPASMRVWTPYAGWLLLAMPAFAYEIHHSTENSLTVNIGWYVAGLSYFTSAISKILEPHWYNGTALYEMYGFPVKTGLYLFLAEYKSFMIFSNYSIIFIELLALPMMFTKKYRFHSWIALLMMHILILFMLRIREVSIFMILFSLFLFEPSWITKLKMKSKQ